MRFCHVVCEGASLEGAQVWERNRQLFLIKSGHLLTTWESSGDWWNLYNRSHPHPPYQRQHYFPPQIQVQKELFLPLHLWVCPQGWQWKLLLWWRMIFVLNGENLKERFMTMVTYDKYNSICRYLPSRQILRQPLKQHKVFSPGQPSLCPGLEHSSSSGWPRGRGRHCLGGGGTGTVGHFLGYSAWQQIPNSPENSPLERRQGWIEDIIKRRIDTRIKLTIWSNLLSPLNLSQKKRGTHFDNLGHSVWISFNLILLNDSSLSAASSLCLLFNFLKPPRLLNPAPLLNLELLEMCSPLWI